MTGPLVFFLFLILGALIQELNFATAYRHQGVVVYVHRPQGRNPARGSTTRSPSTSGVPVQSRNCAPCTCGLSRSAQRIVGGQQTEELEYPWMVVLRKLGNFFCGASLITNQHILTAAHCATGMRAQELDVKIYTQTIFGSSAETQTRRIATMTIHPQYAAQTFNNDIAVMTLSAPVQWTENLRPVCLPTTNRTFAGMTGIITGWGATAESGQVSKTLLEVQVPILTNQNCTASGMKITKNMICAGIKKGGKDACQGDSGGPMHVRQGNKYYQVGVVSWGEGCARPNHPGIYTRVNNYLPWIKSSTTGGCYC